MKKLSLIAVLAIFSFVFLSIATECRAERMLSHGYSKAETTSEVIEKLKRYPSDSGLLINLSGQLKTETNPLLRQQGLAVIAAAMLLKGETVVGLKAIRALEKQYPNSEYTGALSLGNIATPCPNCQGEGRVWRECPVCDGSGKCQMCMGTGHYKMKLEEAKDVVCPKCGGSGDCPSCNGSGRKYRECHKCQGAGFILDKKRLLEVYSDVLKGKPQPINDHDGDVLKKQENKAGGDALQYF